LNQERSAEYDYRYGRNGLGVNPCQRNNRQNYSRNSAYRIGQPAIGRASTGVDDSVYVVLMIFLLSNQII